MLHQNNGGMQKPGDGRRHGDPDEIAGQIEQTDIELDSESRIPKPDSLL